MKQIFRTVFLSLMLAAFLFGTTGVSFYIHECSSSQTKEVFAFPELLNKTVTCCCADEVHGGISSGETVSSFNEPECCKNTHHYLKASFTGFPVFYQFNADLCQKMITADLLNLFPDDPDSEISTFTLRVDHPPPRYGKLLVHFLQQLKIPVPVS
jgi:hypothetical protein